jgi:hypothetical protein
MPVLDLGVKTANNATAATDQAERFRGLAPEQAVS